MDSTSLTKPVDLQGLSLALAKTKADYEGKIDTLTKNLPHANAIVLTDGIDTDNVTSDINAIELYGNLINSYSLGDTTNCFPVTVIYDNNYYAGSIEYNNIDVISYTLYFNDSAYFTNTSPYNVWSPLSNIGADWLETYNYSKQYIQNKPAIRAGEGENSVLIGQIESSDQTAEYSINITGDAKATTFSYTPNGTDLTSSAIGWAAYLSTAPSTRKWQLITSVDPNNHTITFTDYYSSSAISNEVLIVYNNYNKLASGSESYAEGITTIAGGNGSHAEGMSTKALGAYSHAEGFSSVATKVYSHAEGHSTRSYGNAAHAEGSYCMATNSYAHAEGHNTIAASKYQHVQGKFNIEDALDVYADIVGNGEINARSNAYTLDWSGNGWYAGKVTVGTAPTADMDVATKAYVDGNAGVTSFNGNTGAITYTAPVTSVNSKTGAIVIDKIKTGSAQNSTEYQIIATPENDNHSSPVFVYDEAMATVSKYAGNYARLTLGTSTTPGVARLYSNDKVDYYTDIKASTTSSNKTIVFPNADGTVALTSDIVSNLSGLADTNISSPTDGQVLQYDATNDTWVNVTLPTGITETRVNELIAAALAQYGNGDTATYGYNDASEVNY